MNRPLLVAGMEERDPLILGLEHIVLLDHSVAERAYASLVQETVNYFTRAPRLSKVWLDVFIRNDILGGKPDWRFKTSTNKYFEDAQLRDFLFTSITLVKYLLKDYDKVMAEMQGSRAELLRKMEDYKRRSLYV